MSCAAAPKRRDICRAGATAISRKSSQIFQNYNKTSIEHTQKYLFSEKRLKSRGLNIHEKQILVVKKIVKMRIARRASPGDRICLHMAAPRDLSSAGAEGNLPVRASVSPSLFQVHPGRREFANVLKDVEECACQLGYLTNLVVQSTIHSSHCMFTQSWWIQDRHCHTSLQTCKSMLSVFEALCAQYPKFRHPLSCTKDPSCASTPIVVLSREHGHVCVSQQICQPGNSGSPELLCCPLQGVERLLSLGVDVNLRSVGGMTPLGVAAFWGFPEISRCLLKHR